MRKNGLPIRSRQLFIRQWSSSKSEAARFCGCPHSLLVMLFCAAVPFGRSSPPPTDYRILKGANSTPVSDSPTLQTFDGITVQVTLIERIKPCSAASRDACVLIFHCQWWQFSRTLIGSMPGSTCDNACSSSCPIYHVMEEKLDFDRLTVPGSL